jgi:hypothetical protein
MLIHSEYFSRILVQSTWAQSWAVATKVDILLICKGKMSTHFFEWTSRFKISMYSFNLLSLYFYLEMGKVFMFVTYVYGHSKISEKKHANLLYCFILL